jgi:hypothetical protein
LAKEIDRIEREEGEGKRKKGKGRRVTWEDSVTRKFLVGSSKNYYSTIDKRANH